MKHVLIIVFLLTAVVGYSQDNTKEIKVDTTKKAVQLKDTAKLVQPKDIPLDTVTVAYRFSVREIQLLKQAIEEANLPKNDAAVLYAKILGIASKEVEAYRVRVADELNRKNKKK
jgi:hypothetical protein